MEIRTITAFSFRFRHVLVALAGIGLVGCAGGVAGVEEGGLQDEAPYEAEVASTEAELIRGSGSPGLGYKCDASGNCTCDKSIENDCEDMSGVCRDADIDDLIRCIDGWLTTDCSCKKIGFVAPKGSLPYALPTGGVKALKAF